MYVEPEEYDAATVAAHNELACAYANDQLEVPQPIDENLWKLAKKISVVAIRTANHHDGTEGFYSMSVPSEHRTRNMTIAAHRDFGVMETGL